MTFSEFSISFSFILKSMEVCLLIILKNDSLFCLVMLETSVLLALSLNTFNILISSFLLKFSNGIKDMLAFVETVTVSMNLPKKLLKNLVKLVF